MEDCRSIAEIRQPKAFQQTKHQVDAQRLAWCTPPRAGHSSYLVIGGKAYGVPFPTVCFDRDMRLRHDAPVPLRYRWYNLRHGLKDATCNLLTGSFENFDPKLLLQRGRWKSLWNQGNFQLCAAKRAESNVDSVVLHWDGCNSSAQMFYTLRHFGLSAHLLIDDDATVYQMLDLKVDKGFHAGWMNERSIGIEISNPIDTSVEPSTPRSVVKGLMPHLQKESFYFDFTDLQKQRVCEVVDFLVAHFSIPKALPETIDAEGREPAPKLIGENFSGVCGHYHVSSFKHDPGLSLWPALRAHWTHPHGI